MGVRHGFEYRWCSVMGMEIETTRFPPIRNEDGEMSKRNPIARALRLLRPKIKQNKKLYSRKKIRQSAA